MTSRQRVLEILAGGVSDRPAVVCPGGMMSIAVAEVMDACGAAWPAAHRDPTAMLTLALAMRQATGFDNVGLPFCMTLEAEAYGASVDLGGRLTQPRVRDPLLEGDKAELPQPDFRVGRAGVFLETLRAARTRNPDVAVIGNLVGPFSLLGMLCQPLQVLRWTRRNPSLLASRMERLSEDLVEFGRLQHKAGIDALCIAEPTATGEILGAELFRTAVLPHLNRIAAALRRSGLRVIVHICGNVVAIEQELWELQADAVSFDSTTDILTVVQKGPPWQAMGNVSPFLLKEGPAETIRKRCRKLVEGGVRLVAPACGVIPTTPLAHLCAMREATEA